LNPKIYGIPCIFVIGWRGVPGVADEPQHVFQGEITLKLLELLDISFFVIDKGTSTESVKAKLLEWKPLLDSGNSVAFVIKKGALSSVVDPEYSNGYSLNREAVIERILSTSGSDPVISTTGKISRELYEIRERNQQGHKRDFLTVGSMGHASSIALGIASSLPDTKIWCLDGDGAALMHMGALAVIGARAPKNMVHIVLNNAAHESVGGVPTIADRISLCDAAFACGYGHVFSCETQDQLDVALESATSGNALAFIEVKCALGSRKDLGRPKTTPIENKKEFMEHLQS
jgi:phosphonopyruvate decarboxylase